MRIGIDVSQVVYGTGVSVYTKELVKSLLKVDKKNEYVLFGGSLRRRGELKKFISTLEGNYSTKIVPLSPSVADFLWNRLHWGKPEWFLGKIDIFHSSDWTQPPTNAYKVTTVHDLSFFKYPKITPKKIISAQQRRMSRVLKEVDKVIVPSEATKKDLLDLGFDEEKVRVIPEAAGENFKKAKKSKIDNLKKKYKISGGYLLAVGTHPRKNIKRIIKAFEQVRAGKDLKLVVVGSKEEDLDSDRGIRYVGHVEDKELAKLYSGAEVLVYPSLSEGFGLPILQAFACSCPVVTSNASSMPEVAGDAAILVDPWDTDSIIEGIERAISNRKTLVKKGKNRLKDYSWEKTAEMTLDVYNEAKK
jgi:glycosyltransferase involved in cell wall biosynthesis